MDDQNKNPGAAATAAEASIRNTQSKHVEKQIISITPIAQDYSETIVEKMCERCHTIKPISEFRKNNKTVDGYLNTCFACCRPRNAIKRSLRSAINAKCKECIYDPLAGGGSWKKQVTACTSPNCPLFEVRPMAGGSA